MRAVLFFCSLCCVAVAQAEAFEGATAGAVKEITGVRLCWCPPGSFLMGSPPDETERRPEVERQVEVTLTRGFWCGQYEVTQGQWQRVMQAPPPATDAGAGDDFPAYTMNFAQAEEFCARLTALAHQSGQLPELWEFRLPTDAQWEYACRAGTTTATAFGDSLSSNQANFLGDKPYNGAQKGPALDRTVAVGTYQHNPWNLYDMHGNVFEWCRDWFHPRVPGGTDPDLYKFKAKSRVRRGGCYADEGWPCRSAFRLAFEPERAHSHIGMRVVCVQE